MIFEPKVSRNVPIPLSNALDSERFGRELIEGIVEGKFGVKDFWKRPAEYGVAQLTKLMNTHDSLSANVVLTGVSKGGRDQEVFDEALDLLKHITCIWVAYGLKGFTGLRVHVFCSIEIDGVAFEADACWVDADGIIEEAA